MTKFLLVGDQILKILLPTEKITRICEWASGYLQPCFRNVHEHLRYYTDITIANHSRIDK